MRFGWGLRTPLFSFLGCSFVCCCYFLTSSPKLATLPKELHGLLLTSQKHDSCCRSVVGKWILLKWQPLPTTTSSVRDGSPSCRRLGTAAPGDPKGCSCTHTTWRPIFCPRCMKTCWKSKGTCIFYSFLWKSHIRTVALCFSSKVAKNQEWT